MSREIKGIAIILLCYLVGEILSRLIGGFMPGSILGMILLFILLECGVVKSNSIKKVCDFVLHNMMILFVPITAGIMISIETIRDNWLSVTIAMVIVTAVVMLVVGAIQQTLGKRWRR